MKIKIYLAIFFIPFIFQNTLFSGQFNVANSSASSQKNVNQIVQELILEEQALWRELEKLGVKKVAIKALQKNELRDYMAWIKEFEKMRLPKQFSSSFQCLIDKVLKEFNINKNSITIIRYSNPEFGMATDFQLFLDEDELSQFPIEAQEFLIAHELQHIIQKDNSERFFVYRALNPTPAQEADPTHIINKYYRFQENRADALAAMKKAYYAKGDVAFFKHLVMIWGTESAGVKHPTESMRIALATKILLSFPATIV